MLGQQRKKDRSQGQNLPLHTLKLKQAHSPHSSGSSQQGDHLLFDSHKLKVRSKKSSILSEQ
jgi:hypothetical protein